MFAFNPNKTLKDMSQNHHTSDAYKAVFIFNYIATLKPAHDLPLGLSDDPTKLKCRLFGYLTLNQLIQNTLGKCQ